MTRLLSPLRSAWERFLVLFCSCMWEWGMEGTQCFCRDILLCPESQRLAALLWMHKCCLCLSPGQEEGSWLIMNYKFPCCCRNSVLKQQGPCNAPHQPVAEKMLHSCSVLQVPSFAHECQLFSKLGNAPRHLKWDTVPGVQDTGPDRALMWSSTGTPESFLLDVSSIGYFSLKSLSS